jgi:hypothetical protein
MDAVTHVDHACRGEGTTYGSGVVHVVVVSEDRYRPVGGAKTFEWTGDAGDVVGGDGDEVAGNCDEVRSLLVDKVDYAIQALRCHPAVHVDVAYVHHPIPIEREREPG